MQRKIVPMIFSTDMVKAILSGNKTKTRRIVKSKSERGIIGVNTNNKGKLIAVNSIGWDDENIEKDVPFHQIGTILWVKETFREYYLDDDIDNKIIDYRADEYENLQLHDGNGFAMWNKDGSEKMIPWTPSIYMPKKYARIFLEITDVRVEKLTNISTDDALKEGIIKFDNEDSVIYLYGLPSWEKKDLVCSPCFAFQKLWQKINGTDSWDKETYVFVYEFKDVSSTFKIENQ